VARGDDTFTPLRIPPTVSTTTVFFFGDASFLGFGAGFFASFAAFLA